MDLDTRGICTLRMKPIKGMAVLAPNMLNFQIWSTLVKILKLFKLSPWTNSYLTGTFSHLVCSFRMSENNLESKDLQESAV